MSILQGLQSKPRAACAGMALVGALSVLLMWSLPELIKLINMPAHQFRDYILSLIYSLILPSIYPLAMGLYLFALKKARIWQVLLYVPLGGLVFYMVTLSVRVFLDLCDLGLPFDLVIPCTAFFGGAEWATGLAIATAIVFSRFRKVRYFLALVVTGASSGLMAGGIVEIADMSVFLDSFLADSVLLGLPQAAMAFVIGWGLIAAHPARA